MRLEGKTALVTGAASGLGREIALRFVREGASVALIDRNAENLQAVLAECRTAGGRALSSVADIGSEEEVTSAVKAAVAELGPIDVLVNSAGLGRAAPFLETGMDLFDQVYRVNIRGLFFMTQEVTRGMVGRGGNIINIASASGTRGNTDRSVYGSSKAAVISLTESLAVELAPQKIRVNAVSPGPIETEMTRHFDDAKRRMWTDVVPQARFGQPADIAAAAVYLASDEAGFVTGHILNVDGGLYCAGLLNKSGR